jgi:hypothetical protein
VQKVCEECGDLMTARRSTKRYCSEACKQRAKRKWQREEEAVTGCRVCGKPLPRYDKNITVKVAGWPGGPPVVWLPDKLTKAEMRRARRQFPPVRYARLTDSGWARRYGPRAYCSEECRRVARRKRERLARYRRRVEDEQAEAMERERLYRVAQENAYRVTREPDWPLECGHTREWHENAELVLRLLEAGRIFIAQPDQPAPEGGPRASTARQGDNTDGLFASLGSPPWERQSEEWDGLTDFS